MVEKRPGFLRRVFGGLWNGLNFTRRLFVNLIFLALLILVLSALFGGGDKGIKDKTTLVLDPRGEIVDQLSGNPGDLALARALGEEVAETQLRDISTALEKAAEDKNVNQILLRLSDFSGAGVSTLREVGRALDTFRKSGKKVIAYAEYYDQQAYYLATHADEIYVHPDGIVLIEGLGRYRTYYRSLLDKLGIKMHVFRVGRYKSAVEPYLMDGPSPDAREADLYWLEDVWTTFLEDIASARKLEVANLRLMIDELPQRLTAAGGNTAQLALNEKLIDGTKTPDELRDMLIASGALDEEEETFLHIGLSDYVKRFPTLPVIGDQDQIGIIVAAGEITGGHQPQGTIGGKSTSDLVRKARKDKNIKAIVLRVDSPGGSVLDSELIRREIEVTRAAGKPVVVSMGDLAASGGYYISMSSDMIFAEATTITGSIGIFGLFPDASETMDKIGVHAEGSTTTWLAGALDPRRPLDPRLGELLQTNINHGYRDFIGKVAAARGKTPEEIDAVAQGRVWSGKQALDRGLVDKLGGLSDAVAEAASRAKLGEGYKTVYVEKDLSGFERFVASMNARAQSTLRSSLLQAWVPSFLAPSMQADLERQLAVLKDWENRPLSTYAFCFCEIE